LAGTSTYVTENDGEYGETPACVTLQDNSCTWFRSLQGKRSFTSTNPTYCILAAGHFI